MLTLPRIFEFPQSLPKREELKEGELQGCLDAAYFPQEKIDSEF